MIHIIVHVPFVQKYLFLIICLRSDFVSKCAAPKCHTTDALSLSINTIIVYMQRQGNFNPLGANIGKTRAKARFSAVLWIRIRIGFGLNGVPGSGSGSRRAKMTHTNRKSSQISFFEVLNVFFWGMKASFVAWTSFIFFCNYWSSKHWIQIGSISGSVSGFTGNAGFGSTALLLHGISEYCS